MIYSFHQFTENFEVSPFRRKTQLVFLEKRNDDFFEFFSVKHFETIAMLMVCAAVFLKIDTAASKIIFQCIKNCFIAFDEFDVESWLDPSSSDSFG